MVVLVLAVAVSELRRAAAWDVSKVRAFHAREHLEVALALAQQVLDHVEVHAAHRRRLVH